MKKIFTQILFFKLFFVLAALSIFFSGCGDKTDDPVPPETGTLTDIDNNVYKTIKIGNQWWMAENLRVKKYRNGTPVNFAEADTEWADTLASYCVFDNATNLGLLYNWFCVNDANNIAPVGWHIPSDNEWKELEKFLGMSQQEADKRSWRGTIEGDKLKIEGLKGWSAYENVWPTNESGFTALAGGCRLFNGVLGNPGLFSTGYWWTSTRYSEKNSWYRYLDYKNSEVFRSNADVNYGFSIRCVKD